MSMSDNHQGKSNGVDHDLLGNLSSLVLGPAPTEAIAVVQTQLAQVVGLAMQNVVAQQQTHHTIYNAIATKALNALAEQNPAQALEEARKPAPNDIADTLTKLSKLIEGIKNPSSGLQPGE
jgi:Killing trait